MKSRYGNFEHQILSRVSNIDRRHESTWWKDLSKFKRRADKEEFVFVGKIRHKLGNGSSIPFWSVAWHGEYGKFE